MADAVVRSPLDSGTSPARGVVEPWVITRHQAAVHASQGAGTHDDIDSNITSGPWTSNLTSTGDQLDVQFYNVDNDYYVFPVVHFDVGSISGTLEPEAKVRHGAASKWWGVDEDPGTITPANADIAGGHRLVHNTGTVDMEIGGAAPSSLVVYQSTTIPPGSYRWLSIQILIETTGFSTSSISFGLAGSGCELVVQGIRT